MEKLIEIMQDELIPHIMGICQDFYAKKIPLDDGLFMHTIQSDEFIASIDESITQELNADTQIQLVFALNDGDTTITEPQIDEKHHIMDVKLKALVLKIYDLSLNKEDSDINIPTAADLQKLFKLG